MTGIRNYAMEIANALARADAQTLAEIGFELLASLGKADAAVSLLEVRREKERIRKRRSRDVTGSHVTGRDNPPASPFSPTPPFTPPSSTSSSREAEIAKRLPSDAGRTALTAVLSRVSDRLSVAAEIGMILDGGRPNVSHSPAHMELALCDYAANGLSSGHFNAAHFRKHVQRAAEPQRKNGHRTGGVAQRTYDKGMEALRNGG